jgi:signal transduction histidine kinase
VREPDEELLRTMASIGGHIGQFIQRVRAERDREQLLTELKKAVLARDEFLSVASHELKTPLTPLLLRMQMLERELDGQPDSAFAQTVKSCVATGRHQVKRLSELVGDLLDVSRIAGGRLRLELEQVDLASVVREVCARYEPQAAKERTPLSLRLDEPAVGVWDRLRLEQIATNLIDNALKYGAGNPIDVSVDVNDGAAVLTVADRGIGIAIEHLPRIFDRYARAVSERHFGGLGLGLYITRTMVQALGGQIEVASKPGAGSTFKVTLPLTSAVDAAASRPSPS